MSERIFKVVEAVRKATKPPSIGDALIGEVRRHLHKFVDTKVKPTLSRPGDESGKHYLYVDPRIKREDLD